MFWCQMRINWNISSLYTNTSGCSASGRAAAFYLSRLGSNPRTDIGFFLVQNCCEAILAWCKAFSTCNRMVNNRPSSFLFPIIF